MTAQNPGHQPVDRNKWEAALREAAAARRVGRRELAFGLLMATYGDWDGSEVRPGLRTLGETFGCSRSTAIETTRTLVETGWLTQVVAGSGRRPTEYRLTAPSGTAEETATRASGTPERTATAEPGASGSQSGASGTPEGRSGTAEETEPKTLDLRAPHATNGHRPAPTWAQGWAQIERYVKRYGQHDQDRPDPADVIDPKTLETLATLGGIGAVRRDEKNRWDFRDAWQAAP